MFAENQIVSLLREVVELQKQTNCLLEEIKLSARPELLEETYSRMLLNDTDVTSHLQKFFEVCEEEVRETKQRFSYYFRKQGKQHLDYTDYRNHFCTWFNQINAQKLKRNV